MISLKLTEDTALHKNRGECLNYLKSHKVDVGPTSTASEQCRSPFPAAGSITAPRKKARWSEASPAVRL